jgi:hypothetical protein
MENVEKVPFIGRILLRQEINFVDPSLGCKSRYCVFGCIDDADDVGTCTCVNENSNISVSSFLALSQASLLTITYLCRKLL